MTPAATAKQYKSPSIFRFSYLFLFIRNNTTSPIPAPEHSPEITDAKDMASFKYSWVSITDAAQFGINPISAAIAGWSSEFPSKTSDSFCIPITSIHRFNAAVNKNRYMVTFTVWFQADFMVPAPLL